MTDQDWLDWRKSWWERDQNPLHAWHAISICLSASPAIPLPDWCARYLATTAGNLTKLMGGIDFRATEAEVSPDQAHDLTAAALGISSQGKKNAFARIANAAKLARHALDADFRQEDGAAIAAIQDERNIDPDRARRLLRQGRKMTRRQV